MGCEEEEKREDSIPAKWRRSHGVKDDVDGLSGHRFAGKEDMSRPLVGEEICLRADDTTSRLLGVDNLLSSTGFANEELGTRSDRARSRTELLPPPVFAHTDRPDETSRVVHTFFSASIYLLMAITELPVRSCKAPTASLMSCSVAMEERWGWWFGMLPSLYEI
jgi:hypothetical protein